MSPCRRERPLTTLIAVVTASLLAMGTTPLRAWQVSHPPLEGTQPLNWEGDLASRMIDQVDRFLLEQIDQSVARRAAHWNRRLESQAAYDPSVQPQRDRLRHLLGLRDQPVRLEGLHLAATTQHPALVAQSDEIEIHEVWWPTVGQLTAHGLLVQPARGAIRADVVYIPDADQTPEQVCGLVDGIDPVSHTPLHLAASGCRVVVPALVSRRLEPRRGRANLTHREYIYRSAFELGRHLIGYELQAVLSVTEWMNRTNPDRPVGVAGYGEGGMLALYAAAVEPTIDAAFVSGFFGPRERMWNEPIDRNVFGLLEQFGGAELATLVFPRALIIEASAGPRVILPSEGGAPAELGPVPVEQVQTEFDRALRLVPGLSLPRQSAVYAQSPPQADGFVPPGSRAALTAFVQSLDPQITLNTDAARPEPQRKLADPEQRVRRLVNAMDQHNQAVLADSSQVRSEFMKRQDTSSVEAFEKSNESYRDFFAKEVIGQFELPLLAANPRSRWMEESDKWTRYEVVLDVFSDVFAYGILTIPKDIKAGEKRPVVVCQHGLEGRPQSVIGELQFSAYKAFATQLAERGFITFAPQNIYIFKDRFRTLQRKSYPLKKTLFSIMVPQHQQIVDWLQSLPQVDPDRIAFYGLSYGGKSAMRIPALVTDYCLSICSADFNEWVLKNASTRHNFSYVWTGEYEIFEWDLGSTFNYAEMASLIAPRPFMVERGHFDGVGTDDWVGHEFGKVRFLYAARLGLADRCHIEWFVGPHTINGQDSFDFLHKHLRFP